MKLSILYTFAFLLLSFSSNTYAKELFGTWELKAVTKDPANNGLGLTPFPELITVKKLEDNSAMGILTVKLRNQTKVKEYKFKMDDETEFENTQEYDNKKPPYSVVEAAHLSHRRDNMRLAMVWIKKNSSGKPVWIGFGKYEMSALDNGDLFFRRVNGRESKVTNASEVFFEATYKVKSND